MTVVVERPGRVPYGAAFELQQQRRDAVLAGTGPETLLLLEHPDVITFGRSVRDGRRGGSLRIAENELATAGYEVFHVNRGGDVTWHGPGQLVGYPILDLSRRGRDVHVYLRSIEEVLIDVLADFGISGVRREGYAGVWLDERRKIASIGVGVRRWVTLHGFALNVCCDLARFDAIVPCGLQGIEMTSMQQVLGSAVDPAQVTDRMEVHFQKVFG